MSRKDAVAITGGTKGIGAAIARAFHRAGYEVFVGGRHETALARELGAGCHFVEMDVRNEAGHLALRDAARASGAGLRVWINCAGVSAWRPIAEIDAAFWDEMIAVNLTGALWGSKTAAACLPAGGSIINISSLAGRRGSANNSAYCAAKFGMTGLTQALAKELGAAGIRVNAVCPVYVVTPGLLDALGDPRSPAAGRPIAPFLDEFAQAQAALKRLPTGEEVGETCLYLASDGASAITGQSINVDCGVMPT